MTDVQDVAIEATRITQGDFARPIAAAAVVARQGVRPSISVPDGKSEFSFARVATVSYV